MKQESGPREKRRLERPILRLKNNNNSQKKECSSPSNSLFFLWLVTINLLSPSTYSALFGTTLHLYTFNVSRSLSTHGLQFAGRPSLLASGVATVWTWTEWMDYWTGGAEGNPKGKGHPHPVSPPLLSLGPDCVIGRRTKRCGKLERGFNQTGENVGIRSKAGKVKRRLW